MTSKESCPVWGGAVGKVPYPGQLAGRLLYCYAAFLQRLYADKEMGDCGNHRQLAIA